MAQPAKNRIFPFLDSAEETALLAEAISKTVTPDEVVFEQGVQVHAIFVIESGSLRVERVNNGTAIHIATLYEGEIFGEISFVDGDPTSARVVADEDAELLIIEKTVIHKMTQQWAGFEARLYRSIAATLAQRLRLTDTRMFANPSWG